MFLLGFKINILILLGIGLYGCFYLCRNFFYNLIKKDISLMDCILVLFFIIYGMIYCLNMSIRTSNQGFSEFITILLLSICKPWCAFFLVLSQFLCSIIFFNPLMIIIGSVELLDFILLIIIHRKGKFQSHFFLMKFISFLSLSLFIISYNLFLQWSIFQSLNNIKYSLKFMKRIVTIKDFLMVDFNTFGIKNISEFVHNEKILLSLSFFRSWLFSFVLFFNLMRLGIYFEKKSLSRNYYIGLIITFIGFSISFYFKKFIIAMIFFHLSLPFMFIFALLGQYTMWTTSYMMIGWISFIFFYDHGIFMLFTAGFIIGVFNPLFKIF